MDITMRSEATGNWHTRDIDVDLYEYSAWKCGRDQRHIQEVFPYLSDDDREFLISGTTPEEWDSLFGDIDEEVEEDYTDYQDGWSDEYEGDFSWTDEAPF